MHQDQDYRGESYKYDESASVQVNHSHGPSGASVLGGGSNRLGNESFQCTIHALKDGDAHHCNDYVAHASACESPRVLNVFADETCIDQLCKALQDESGHCRESNARYIQKLAT